MELFHLSLIFMCRELTLKSFCPESFDTGIVRKLRKFSVLRLNDFFYREAKHSVLTYGRGHLGKRRTCKSRFFSTAKNKRF